MIRALMRTLVARWRTRTTVADLRRLDRRLRRDIGIPLELLARLDAEDPPFVAPLIVPRRDRC